MLEGMDGCCERRGVKEGGKPGAHRGEEIGRVSEHNLDRLEPLRSGGRDPDEQQDDERHPDDRPHLDRGRGGC